MHICKTCQTLRVHSTVSVAFLLSTPKRSKRLTPNIPAVTCERAHMWTDDLALSKASVFAVPFNRIELRFQLFLNVYVFAEDNERLAKSHKTDTRFHDWKRISVDRAWTWEKHIPRKHGTFTGENGLSAFVNNLFDCHNVNTALAESSWKKIIGLGFVTRLLLAEVLRWS